MKITDIQRDHIVNIISNELWNQDGYSIDYEICIDIVHNILRELGIEIDYVSGGKGPED